MHRIWPSDYGFSIAGGVPVVVSQVKNGSSAHRAGLLAGDQIVSINKKDVQDFSKEEIIRFANEQPKVPPEISVVSRIRNILLNKQNSKDFGLSFKGSGPVFISFVTNDSHAAYLGIQPGDIVTEVNGINVRNSSHTLVNKLVCSLKSQLHLIVIAGAVKLSKREKKNKNREQWKDYLRQLIDYCFLGEDVLKIALMDLLIKYVSNKNITKFTIDLKRILSKSHYGPLIPYIRSMLPWEHRQKFDELMYSLRSNHATLKLHLSLSRHFANETFGMILTQHTPLTIHSLVNNGAAHQSGLMAGDIILQINGKDVRHRSYDDVINLLLNSGLHTVFLVERKAHLEADNSLSLQQQTRELKEQSMTRLSNGEQLVFRQALVCYVETRDMDELFKILTVLLDKPYKIQLLHYLEALIPADVRSEFIQKGIKLLNSHLNNKRVAYSTIMSGRNSPSMRRIIATEGILSDAESENSDNECESYDSFGDSSRLVCETQLTNIKKGSTLDVLLSLDKQDCRVEWFKTDERSTEQNIKTEALVHDRYTKVLKNHRQPRHLGSPAVNRSPTGLSQRGVLEQQEEREVNDEELLPGLPPSPCEKNNFGYEQMRQNKRYVQEKISSHFSTESHLVESTETLVQRPFYHTYCGDEQKDHTRCSSGLKRFSRSSHGLGDHSYDGSHPRGGDEWGNFTYDGNHSRGGDEQGNFTYDANRSRNRKELRENTYGEIHSRGGDEMGDFTYGGNHLRGGDEAGKSTCDGNHSRNGEELRENTYGGSHLRGGVGRGIIHRAHNEVTGKKTNTHLSEILRHHPLLLSNQNEDKIEGDKKNEENAQPQQEKMFEKQMLPGKQSPLSREGSVMLETTPVPPKLLTPPTNQATSSPEISKSQPPPAPPPPPPPPPPQCMLNIARKDVKDTSIRLKRLNWEKVRTTKNTVWNEIDNDSGMGMINCKELEELFSNKPIKVTEKKVHVEQSILNSKKAHAIDILLAYLKVPEERIYEAILQFDQQLLTVDHLKTLNSAAPDRKEIQLLTSSKNNVNTKADKFTKKMLEISDYGNRLKSMIFRTEYEDRKNELCQDIMNVRNACRQLKNSSKLKVILELVLATGNFMNKEYKSVSGASGFKISLLPKLMALKSAGNRSSLLSVLLNTLLDKKSDVLDVNEELRSVPDAAKVSSHVLKEELDEFRSGMKQINEALVTSQLRKDGQSNDKFVTVMNQFVNEAHHSFHELLTQYTQMQCDFQQLVTFFGDDYTKTTTEDFFGSFAIFLQHIESTKEDLLKTQRKESISNSAKNVRERLSLCGLDNQKFAEEIKRRKSLPAFKQKAFNQKEKESEISNNAVRFQDNGEQEKQLAEEFVTMEKESLQNIARVVSNITKQDSITGGGSTLPIHVETRNVSVDIDSDATTSMHSAGRSLSPRSWVSPHNSPSQTKNRFKTGKSMLDEAKKSDNVKLQNTDSLTTELDDKSIRLQKTSTDETRLKQGSCNENSQVDNNNSKVTTFELSAPAHSNTNTPPQILSGNSQPLLEERNIMSPDVLSKPKPNKTLEVNRMEEELNAYNAAIKSSRSPQGAPKFLSLVKAKLNEKPKPKLKRRITKHEQPLYARVMKDTLNEYELQRKKSIKRRQEAENASPLTRRKIVNDSPNFLDIMQKKLSEKAPLDETIDEIQTRESLAEPLYAVAIRETLKDYADRKDEHERVRKTGNEGLFLKHSLSGRNTPNFLVMLHENLKEKQLLNEDMESDINNSLTEEDPVYAMVIKAAISEHRKSVIIKEQSSEEKDSEISPTSISAGNGISKEHSYDGDHSCSSSDISLTSEEVNQINQKCFRTSFDKPDDNTITGQYLKSGSKPGLPTIPSPDYASQTASETESVNSHPYHVERPFWNGEAKTHVKTNLVDDSSTSTSPTEYQEKKRVSRSSLRKKESIPKLTNVSFVKQVEVIDEVVEENDGNIVRTDLRTESPLKGSPTIQQKQDFELKRKMTPFTKPHEIPVQDEVFEEASKLKNRIIKQKSTDQSPPPVSEVMHTLKQSQSDSSSATTSITMPLTIQSEDASNNEHDGVFNLSFNLVTTNYPEGKISMKLVPQGNTPFNIDAQEIILDAPHKIRHSKPLPSLPPNAPPEINRFSKPTEAKRHGVTSPSIDVRHGNDSLLRTIIPSPDYSPATSPTSSPGLMKKDKSSYDRFTPEVEHAFINKERKASPSFLPAEMVATSQFAQPVEKPLIQVYTELYVPKNNDIQMSPTSLPSPLQEKHQQNPISKDLSLLPRRSPLRLSSAASRDDEVMAPVPDRAKKIRNTDSNTFPALPPRSPVLQPAHPALPVSAPEFSEC